jgi:hypothetical protein
MTFARWVQASTALLMLAAWVPPRIGVLRPHARRIALVGLAIYVVFAVAVVTLRIVAGPGPFME